MRGTDGGRDSDYLGDRLGSRGRRLNPVPGDVGKGKGALQASLPGFSYRWELLLASRVVQHQ